jgi:hypothetical protein
MDSFLCCCCWNNIPIYWVCVCVPLNSWENLGEEAESGDEVGEEADEASLTEEVEKVTSLFICGDDKSLSVGGGCVMNDNYSSFL